MLPQPSTAGTSTGNSWRHSTVHPPSDTLVIEGSLIHTSASARVQGIDDPAGVAGRPLQLAPGLVGARVGAAQLAPRTAALARAARHAARAARAARHAALARPALY